MSTRDLINLGVSPDSGTGDSARRGGEKVNQLFADIYSNFGDYPIILNQTSDFYGLPYHEDAGIDLKYKVGELHAAGYYIPVSFDSDGWAQSNLDSETGWDKYRRY